MQDSILIIAYLRLFQERRLQVSGLELYSWSFISKPQSSTSWT